MQLEEGCESGVDLALGAGLQDMEPQPLRASCFLRLSNDALGNRIVRVHQHGDHLGLGNQLGQQIEPLGHQLDGEDAKSRQVASPGRDKLATKPRSNGSPLEKTIGIVEVALFAASTEGVPPVAIKSTLPPTRSAANPGSRS